MAPKGVTSIGLAPLFLSYDMKGSFEGEGVGGTCRSWRCLPGVPVVTFKMGFEGVSCVRCFGPGEATLTVLSDPDPPRGSFPCAVEPDLVEPSLAASCGEPLVLALRAFIWIMPSGMTNSSFGLVHCVFPVPVW